MEAGPPGREASAQAGQAAGGRQANTEAGREQPGRKGGFPVKCSSQAAAVSVKDADIVCENSSTFCDSKNL
jgi:hypothetical protein